MSAVRSISVKDDTVRFRALGEPTRLRLLALLAERERCVCELTEALDAAQPRLSYHLQILREAGLVQDRPDGRWVYYSLRPEAFGELAGVLGHLARPAATPEPGLTPRC